MSLTLKILLAADAFFALLLVLYLTLKYGKLFSKKPEIFKPEIKDGVEIEPEVTYEEEKISVVTQTIIQKPEEGIATGEKAMSDSGENAQVQEEVKLTIGSFEDLEDLVNGKK